MPNKMPAKGEGQVKGGRFFEISDRQEERMLMSLPNAKQTHKSTA
jgi:hypothetical protein